MRSRVSGLMLSVIFPPDPGATLGPSPAAAYPARDMDSPRWATFDCYGTLVDWNAGIGRELGRLFGADAGPPLLERYHAIEPRIQREHPGARYREVMALVLEELARES